MERFNYLDEEKMDDVLNRIDEMESSLMGLVTLLRNLKNINFDGGDLCGVGKLIEGQAEQLSDMADILRGGSRGKI